MSTGTVYSHIGASVYLSKKENAVPTTDKLPANTYTVRWDDVRGCYYLELSDNFTLPPKLYGDCEDMAERFLNTFHDRPSVTGVLLSGLKGSGKSLTAKKTSILAREKYDMPTIIVASPFYGAQFNDFIQSIGDECVLFFDEFEKVYDDEKQMQLLTLLDGVYPTKKLVLMTSNSTYGLNEHLKNRPGRIYYLLTYRNIEAGFIREYALDCLKKELHDEIEMMVRLAGLIRDFNFDMLKALVEELNRYGGTVKDAINVLNINFDYDSRQNYMATVERVSGTYGPVGIIETEHTHPTLFANPLQQSRLNFQFTDALADNGLHTKREMVTINMRDNRNVKVSDDLEHVTIHAESGTDKYIIRMKREHMYRYDYNSLL